MTTTAIPENILSRINAVKDFQAAAAKREAEIKAQEEAETLARCEQKYAVLKDALLKLFPEDIQPYVVFGEMPSEYNLDNGSFDKRVEIPGLVPITILTSYKGSSIHSFRVNVPQLIIEWNSEMAEYLPDWISLSNAQDFKEFGPALVFAQEQQELLDSYNQQILDAKKRAASRFVEREALAEKRQAELEAVVPMLHPVKSQDEIRRDRIVATLQSSPIGQAFAEAVSMLVDELNELHQDDEYQDSVSGHKRKEP